MLREVQTVQDCDPFQWRIKQNESPKLPQRISNTCRPIYLREICEWRVAKPSVEPAENPTRMYMGCHPPLRHNISINPLSETCLAVFRESLSDVSV